MPALLPYMKITDPDTGLCYEIVQNCRTLAAADQQPEWSTNQFCEDCCPDCTDEGFSGDLAQDGAFWVGNGDPAETDFLGFVAKSMELEPSTSVRRRGETTLEPLPYTPRRLTVRGYFMARTRAGTYLGESVYTDLLQGSGGCSGCDGWEAEIRAFCVDADTQSDPILEIWTPDEPEPLTGDPAACGPCDQVEDGYQADRLGPPLLPLPDSLDNGARSLLRVRFVSMDEDEDVDVVWPYCWGRFVAIQFEVLSDFDWGEAVESVCMLDQGFDTYESGRCRPIDWTQCRFEPAEAVCLDPAETTSTEITEGVRAAGPVETVACTPIMRSVRTCLTPRLPVASQVGIGFTVSSGASDLQNLRIQVHEAHHNWPSPQTCEGEFLYGTRRACATGYLRLPANSVATIDPRSGRVDVSCNGGPIENGLRFFEGWDFPLLDPSCRYWLTATADCFQTDPAATIDVRFFGRYSN